jgi:hypothetical protein
MKNLIKLLILSLVFIACDKNEPPTYTGEQSVLLFSVQTSTLEVPIGTTNTLEVEVAASSLSSVDRSLTINIEDVSTANSENYNVPNTVVIPANSYTGTFIIDAEDKSIETSIETIVLSLEGENGEISDNTHTVSLFEICPIPADYMIGDYLIEQQSDEVDGPTLGTGTVVSLSGTGVTRTFETSNYPNYCPTTVNPFSFNLVCGEIVVLTQNNLCVCDSGTDWFSEAIKNETYDLSDDSEFLVTFTDDTQEDCATPAQTTYKFTKQ